MNEHYENILRIARLKKIQNFKEFCLIARVYQKTHETANILSLYLLSKHFMYYVVTCPNKTEELQKEHDRLAALNKVIDQRKKLI